VQVTTASDAQACPNDSGRAVGGQANPGEFDLAMAALCALLSPSQTSVAQGQINSGNEKAPSTETGNITLADQAFLLDGTKDAVSAKEPVDSETAGKDVKEGIQAQAEATIPVDLLNSLALQQIPAVVMVPVQNSQIPVKPSVDGGKSIQQSADPVGQAVLAQFPVVAENTQGNTPAFNAALQSEPGVVVPLDQTCGVKAAPDPSQINVQLPQEMAGLGQEQLNGEIQELTVKNKQKTTLLVAAEGDSKPAKEDGQPGISKTGASGSISPTEKPEIKGTLQETKPTMALSLNQAAQSDGKEIKPGTEKVEALKTGGVAEPVGTGEKSKLLGTPQSNTTQQNTAQFNATQSNPAQLDQSLSAQSTGDASKGVGLPDLKERLVQEIKHFFTTSKAEPQTQVQLKLEPEHLGQLTIKLFFSKGELSAHFYTGNSYVKDALEGSIQQLRDTLGQQDLKLNEAMVFTDDGGRGGMGHFYDGRNGQSASVFGGYSHRTYGDAQVEPVDFRSTETEPSRVNYLI